jgi:hypothetical protein
MLGILQRKRFLFLPAISKWFPQIHQPLGIFIFYALLAAALIAPIASTTNIPNLGDYLTNLAALIQAKIALSNGQFPLRFMPLEHMGWHYPFFQFYSPTTYTYAGLIYEWLTPANPLLAFKITIWSGLVLGGVYMQRIAFWFTQSLPAALLAGVIYLCAPYYIIIINFLGSLNEIVALGILPTVLFYSCQRFYSPRNNVALAKLAIAWYLLATTHIVTFVYASFFIGALLLLVSSKKPRTWRNLTGVGIAYLLGCMLAAWYLAPIDAFKDFFTLNITYSIPEHLTTYHPLLSQLLFPAADITPGFKDNAMLTIHPAVGWPILFSVALCLYARLKKLSSGSQLADAWLAPLLIIFFVAFFLVWSPLNSWRWLPAPFLVGQYCWRLLSQVIWVGALLSATALCLLFKNKLDKNHVIFGTLLIMMSASAWFPASENANASVADFIKQPYLLYNDNSYLLDFNKYTTFVNNIDNTLIEPTKILKTSTDYFIPKPLLQLASNPAAELRADIPDSLSKKNFHLAAYLNNELVDKKDLTLGPLLWNINLLAAKNRYTNSAPLVLKFLLLDKNDKVITETLPIEHALLTGYLNPADILSIRQTQSYCTQKKSITLCDVPVGQGMKFVELPALYYPKLLKLSVNGVSVPYQSILVEGELLAGIVPTQGILNHIQIEFRGLEWANLVSWAGWISIIFILFPYILRFFTHRGSTTNSPTEKTV